MAISRLLRTVLPIVALLSSALLSLELWQVYQLDAYNAAVGKGDFVRAGKFAGARGIFARAYARHREGNYQDARILYSQLENTDDAGLRSAALYNLGNTYLQQAQAFDLDTDADRAQPLIELAKVTYRQLLALDSQHWGAKFNLEHALWLLPDPRDQAPMELEGLRGGVRAVISPDVEGALP